MGTEKNIWVNVVLEFLDDLYPPARVFDVSPVSIDEIFKNRVNFKKKCGLPSY